MIYLSQNKLKGFSAIVLAIAAILLTGCMVNKPIKVDEGLHHKVAVSKDDKELIFSYLLNKKFSLYKYHIDTEKVKLFQEVDGNCLNPSFSPDGKRLLYISYEKQDNGTKNSINLINPDGSGLKRILEVNTFILEAVFSPDNERIYFVTAGSFGNSSPLAQPSFRGMSVFSVDTTGNNSRRELNAFQVQHLSFSTDSRYIFFKLHDAQDSLNGPFMFDLKDRKLESLIDAKSNTLELYTPYRWWSPISSPDPNKVFLVSVFKIFQMPVSTKKLQVIYSSSKEDEESGLRILTIRLFNTSDRIIMVKQKLGQGAGLYILDANGALKKELTLDMAEFKHLP